MQIAIKAVNNTASLNRLVPILLIFSVYLRLDCIKSRGNPRYNKEGTTRLYRETRTRRTRNI